VQGVELGHRQLGDAGMEAMAGMEMENVKAIKLTDHLIKLAILGHPWIAPLAGRPEGSRHAGEELGASEGIPAGKQNHLMTTVDEFVCEIVNNSFRSAISQRRNTFKQW
jgi:hypothetical protein